LFRQGTVVKWMREFLQKQKIGSPTFFLMHKAGAAAPEMIVSF